MKIILMLVLITTISLTAFSQENQTAKDQAFSYAYITVRQKDLSKKLKVEVDFGDTPDQVQAGQDYSDSLTNKKSYAAVLNYMAERQFELVETFALVSSYQGSGGTAGTIYIMRKRK